MDPVNSILSNLCDDVINHVTNNGEMEGDATRHAILVEQFSLFFWGQLFDFFGTSALLVSFYLFVCFGFCFDRTSMEHAKYFNKKL